MRTLFTKILLWFLLTVFVTFGGHVLHHNSFCRTAPPEFNRFGFETREARTAWETQGETG